MVVVFVVAVVADEVGKSAVIVVAVVSYVAGVAFAVVVAVAVVGFLLLLLESSQIKVAGRSDDLDYFLVVCCLHEPEKSLQLFIQERERRQI